MPTKTELKAAAETKAELLGRLARLIVDEKPLSVSVSGGGLPAGLQLASSELVLVERSVIGELITAFSDFGLRYRGPSASPEQLARCRKSAADVTARHLLAAAAKDPAESEKLYAEFYEAEKAFHARIHPDLVAALVDELTHYRYLDHGFNEPDPSDL